MANITGVRTTSNILNNRRMVDMGKQIALLDPNDGPFISFLKLAKKDSRVVYNPRFEWLEDDLVPGQTTLKTAVNDSDTSVLQVNDNGIFRAGDIIHVPSTGENMLVTAAEGITVHVERGYGRTEPAEEMAADAVLLNLGSAMPENSALRGVLSTKERSVYNFTQIFRTPISLSGTEAASKLHGGKDRGYQRRKASLEHKRDIARAMYFGQRKEDTNGETPRRTMGGLLEFMNSANKVTFGSDTLPLTYRNFDVHVAKQAFAHGSKEKLLIAGPNLASAINSWAEHKLVSDVDSEATYGIRVKNLVSTYGDLKVIYDPLLDAGGYEGYGFIVDPENVRYCYLDGRDTKLNIGVQNNDVDGVVDEYLTECSLEVRQPQTHLLIKGAYIEA